MALGDISAGVLLAEVTQAQFDANPGIVLGLGQMAFLLGTDQYKRGDGVTTLSALRWRGTLNKAAATFTSENPVLYAGQIGRESDTRRLKIGDGTTAWNSLRYEGSPRVTSVESTATVTIDCAITDHYELTDLATNVTIAAPLNPVDGKMILYRYKDNGTSRMITRNSVFVDLTGTVPSSTTAGKVGVEGARYSAARAKWEIIATVTEP